MRLFIISCMVGVMVACGVCAPAYAQSSKQKATLQQVEKTLQQEKQAEEKLARQQRDIANKLRDLQEELVSMTPDIQGHERAMMKLAARRAETESNIEAAQNNLEKEHESLAQLVVALQRLNRMPPQALLARPSAPVDMARSYGLLQDVIPAVSAKATEIKQIFTDLKKLRTDLVRQEKELAQETELLQAKRQKLDTVVKQRMALLKQTENQQMATNRKIASLSAQASDLRDLMQKLQKQEKTLPPQAPTARSGVAQWFSKGRAGGLPVSGTVVTGYGTRLASGATSQGLSIQAASGAVVTAPSNGVIRFAGPFRQYKLLVIIQHSNGEHSLLGGMQELYTTLGSTVVTGEPIGKLPSNGSSGKLEGDSTRSASLYYERRREGKPIDPRRARG